VSMGPVGGVVGSAAGTSLSQAAGSESERARESTSQQRSIDANQKAELASGVGHTEEDQESSERDADGRRLWEAPAKRGESKATAEEEAALSRQSKDPTGQSGTKLDLTG
jgi:hypothetical protein